MAVDNAVVLELGYAGRGTTAENHHVCPIHPEYAELPPQLVDPAAAKAMIDEAGMADFEFELISIDDDWQRDTCDAVAAQIRDAGINDQADDPAGFDLLERLDEVSVLGDRTGTCARSACRSWRWPTARARPGTRSAFDNAEFDALLAEALSIADADKRREVMAKIAEDHAGRRRD